MVDPRISADPGGAKGVRVSGAKILEMLREREAAHSELDQYDVPVGTLTERIQHLSESFSTALEGHKNELDDVRREFESAGRSYIRDVEAREREIIRLKHMLTEHGISWNPPEAYRG